MNITMETKRGSRLEMSHGYQIDIVTMHGSTYIAIRICAPLKYIFRFLYLGHHWKLVVIGWIFAYIILLYPINKRYKISFVYIKLADL
jgi:hypothetical protein